MNSLKTLYFPITDISCQRQYPLFLFFRNIHILRIMEEDAAPGSADSFMYSEFCQVHTPAPLGEDRNRFQRLLNDIGSGDNEYASQLGNITLAGLSSQREDGDSGSAILQAITKGSPQPVEKKSAEIRENLWQARLVLGIGEIVDLNEEEVAHNLALLEDDSKEMIRAITGDSEELFENEEGTLSVLSELKFRRGPIHSGDMKNRLSCWKKLYGNTTQEEFHLLLTTSPECGEKLLEEAETLTGIEPSLIASFLLPASIGSLQTDALDVAREFTKAHKETLERIESTVMQAQNDQNDDIVQQWNSLMEDRFPHNLFGRQTLKIYRCESISSSTLFAESRKEPVHEEGNTLLAILD